MYICTICQNPMRRYYQWFIHLFRSDEDRCNNQSAVWVELD